MKTIFVLILCSLILTGCGPKSEPVPTPTPPAVSEVTSAPVETAPAETPAPATPTPTPAPEHMITLYAPNEDVSGFIYTTRELSELSGEAVFNALTEAGVLNAGAGLNSIETDGSQLRVDVNEAFVQQLSSYGTSGEYYMLGSVVNTLLGAYGADSMYITMNGQAIETGHNVYDYALELYP